MTLWGFLFYYCEMNMKWNYEMMKWWNEGDNKKINWTGELINMVIGSYKKTVMWDWLLQRKLWLWWNNTQHLKKIAKIGSGFISIKALAGLEESSSKSTLQPLICTSPPYTKYLLGYVELSALTSVNAAVTSISNSREGLTEEH